VLTEWNEFRAVDLKQLRATMRGDALVDLRNVYQPAHAEAAGFTYRGVGRGALGTLNSPRQLDAALARQNGRAMEIENTDAR